MAGKLHGPVDQGGLGRVAQVKVEEAAAANAVAVLVGKANKDIAAANADGHAEAAGVAVGLSLLQLREQQRTCGEVERGEWFGGGGLQRGRKDKGRKEERGRKCSVAIARAMKARAKGDAVPSNKPVSDDALERC